MYQITEAELRAADAQIKIRLSRHHPDDVDFYYDIKDPLCDIVIDAAEEWALTTSWQMTLTPEEV
jgi:hypothetical protein